MKLFWAVGFLILAGCATGYKPANSGGTIGGYSDAKISEGQYRVTYQGQGESVSAAQVYQLFLLRGAELAKRDGYLFFRVVDGHDDFLRRGAMHVHVEVPNYTGTIVMLESNEPGSFNADDLIKNTPRG